MSSSTKIINVLKDDSFAEILSLFKATPSGEVIFVLPKRSKAFQKEDHFSVLREAADEVNKTVSFLSSNAEVNQFATKHGFEILLAKSSPTTVRKKTGSKKKLTTAGVNVINQIEDFYGQPTSEPELESDEEIGGEDVPLATPMSSRRMSEIVRPDEDEQFNVKVSAAKEKSFPVEVRHELPAEDKQEDAIEEVWAGPSENEAVQEEHPEVKTFFQPKARAARFAIPRKKRLTYTLGSVGVILAGVLVYFNTGSAQVTISPVVTDLNFNIKVIASESVASVDTAGLKIPGQTFTVSKSVSQTFNATGSKDVAQKARGSITLYNSQSTAQPLIATTRFESADGHVFRSLLTVTVPAAKGSGPGTVEVQVIADKIGADYNVPAGDWTVPAFKEQGYTAKYEAVTGVSKSAMRGGTSGKATVVTAEDFEKAKDLLTAQLKQEVVSEVQAQTTGLKVISNADISFSPPESTAMPDEAAETFTMSITGTLKTAGFKEEDLQKLLSAYVDSKNDLDIVSEKIDVNYSEVSFDPVTNILNMTVSVTGPGFAKVDEQKILTDLLGKKEEQIEAYLKSVPGITSANVLLSPVWVRSVPKNSEKVNITVSR